MRIFPLLLILLLVFTSCSKDEETPDTTPPTVSLTIVGIPGSTSGEPIVVSNQIEVNISANDANGISKIEAFIDTDKKGEDKTAPYNLVIDISSYASKNYTLKVVATDKAGNTSSTEKSIDIDNEMPVITEVSLAENSVLTGSENSLTFKASDNEELTSVMAYINDTLLKDFDITSETYEVNIDTEILSDGANTLKIEAKDPAGNVGEYSVNFIIDNTGPNISLSSVTENQILDEALLLQPEVTDDYSEVASLQVFLGDTSLFLFENTNIFDMDFVPDNYPVGANKLKLIAKDSLGNESLLEINIEILRLLIKVSLPNGFLSPHWSSFWVFSSEMNGEPISAKSVTEDNIIKLHASGEFDVNKEYMITFLADENTNPDSFNRITNIQGISRNSLPELNFNLPRRKTVLSNTTVSMVGFGNDEYVTADGIDYSFSHYNQEMSGNFGLVSLSDTNNSSSDYFLYSTTFEGVPYAYLKFIEPLADASSINKTDLITDTDISSNTFSISNDPGILNSQLLIKGYGSNEDYQNGIYHKVYSKSPQKVFGVEYEYHYYSNFNSYSHQLVLDDYLTVRKGLPANSYSIPDWNLDFLQQGNDINVTKSGTEHVLGKLQLSKADGKDYIMTVLFDSQNTDVVTLPQIPEEMQDLHIYNVAQNEGFNLNQIHISSFDGITTYADYLDVVIKNDKKEENISDVINTKMKANNGAELTPFKRFNFE